MYQITDENSNVMYICGACLAQAEADGTAEQWQAIDLYTGDGVTRCDCCQESQQPPKVEYLVFFGNDRYDAERKIKAAKHRYNDLEAAQEYASGYTNAHVIKIVYGDDLAPAEITEID